MPSRDPDVRLAATRRYVATEKGRENHRECDARYRARKAAGPVKPGPRRLKRVSLHDADFLLHLAILTGRSLDSVVRSVIRSDHWGTNRKKV